MDQDTDSGFKIVTVAAKQVNVGRNVIHTKGQRMAASAFDKSNIFTFAVGKLPHGQKFTTLPVKLDDPKQLGTFHAVDSTIKVFTERLIAYDMDDVFNLVKPIDVSNVPTLTEAAGTVVTTNLIEQYSNIRVADVALSNRFYHTWTDDAVCQFHTNLNWSYHALKQNIDPTLMSRLQPKYDAFPSEERGGPLLFILLMNELMFTTESAIKELREQVEKYKINKVPGEDIKKVAGVLLAVSKRIWYSKHLSFPEGYVDTIITILQSSSVPSFNEQFRNVALRRASELATARIQTSQGQDPSPVFHDNTLSTIEMLLNMATTFYDQYTRDGMWAKYVKTKVLSDPEVAAPAANTTQATPSTDTCFNCGSDQHMLPDCPKEIDEARVASNRRAHGETRSRARGTRRNRRGGRGNRGPSPGQTSPATSEANTPTDASTSTSSQRPSRWRPPAEGESDHRFIWTRSHGNQPYKWNPVSRRWDLMVTIPASNQGANAGAAANNVSAPSADNNSEPTNQSDIRASIAELSRQIEIINNRL
jgi:hypothetical protein